MAYYMALCGVSLEIWNMVFHNCICVYTMYLHDLIKISYSKLSRLCLDAMTCACFFVLRLADYVNGIKVVQKCNSDRGMMDW